MTRENRQALFDRWAKDYDHSTRDRSDFPFVGYEDVLDAVRSRTASGRGHAVLDVGIGTGNLAGRFVADGCDVHGLDFSRAMLARVAERFPGVPLVEADLRTGVPALDRRFDRIVSGYVFHEFPAPVKVELIRTFVSDHLAPGGRMVIGDLAFPSREIHDAAAAHWANRWDGDEHYWVAEEMLPELRRAALSARYEQISSCAGVFVVEAAAAARDDLPGSTPRETA